jgi:DNA replication initiation complex subunit (GINS family)
MEGQGVGGSSKNVVITYETLFEILRMEKGRDELQKLDPTFFKDVVAYINEKKQSIKNSQGTLFSEDEKENTELQLQNIKKIIKELYNRREKKIIDTAIMKSRTQSDVIDTASMLEEEKHLFASIVSTLDCARNGLLFNLIEGRMPEKIEMKAPEDKKCPEENTEKKMLRFMNAVPQFYGEDAELYGPFEEEDVACLPKSIAALLINKGRAEEITEEK